jgi:hypothetical protein
MDNPAKADAASHTQMGRLQFIQFQKIILEKLFPQNWFCERRRADHPAYQRWSLCIDLLKRGGHIRFPEQEASLPIYGRLVLDSTVLITLTEGDLQQLRLRSLDLYGDSSVQTFIRSRLTDAKQFEDVMVELAFGAWHKSRGHSVEPIEIRSFPDLKIVIPKYELPFFIECKKLRSASLNRLGKEIQKANAQVKTVGTDCYGIAVLDVTDPVTAGRVEDDTLPASLNEIIKSVQSALHGNKNHTIGAAVLLWDDYMVYGQPPQTTMVAFRRRFHVIYHDEATQPIPTIAPLFEGFTVAYKLSWSPREKQPKECEFHGDLFKKEIQDRFRITPKRAAEAMLQSDRRESLLFDGLEIVLAARHIAKSQNDFYLLVCGEIKQDRYIVHWAFKIFCALCNEIHLLSPLQLLMRFVQDFGLPIKIGSSKGKMIAYHKTEVSETDLNKAVEITNPENKSFFSSFFLRIRTEQRRHFADCALAFCVDTSAYAQWLKACGKKGG